jgi:hypothetical protein
MDENQFSKLDKTVFSVFSLFEEADKEDEKYWLSNPQERLENAELLRTFSLGTMARECRKEIDSIRNFFLVL